MIHSTRDKSIIPFDTEQKIVHHLILESSRYPDTGLFSGKTGLAIFFSHYGRHKQAELYQEVANELINDATDLTDKNLPIGIAAGISGIGWGIEYLLQHGFMTGDNLTLCNEIDKKIMEQDPRRMTDYSLETGMEGLLHYIVIHLKGCISQGDGLPFDETYLHDLYYAVREHSETKDTTPEAKKLAQAYLDFYQNKTAPDYSPTIIPFIEPTELKENQIHLSPPGLQKGLSGILLRQLQITNM